MTIEPEHAQWKGHCHGIRQSGSRTSVWANKSLIAALGAAERNSWRGDTSMGKFIS